MPVAFPLPVEEEVALTGDPALEAAEHGPGPRRRRIRRRRLPWFSGTILLVFVVTGVFASWLAPYDPEALDLGASMQPPWFAGGSSDHILGTDDLGRDVLSRLIYGARVSLLVAIAVVVLAGVVGVTIAMIAGYK